MRIGIDIGGTSAKLGLVDGAGKIPRRSQVETGRAISAEELVCRLGAACAELGAGISLEGIGLAAPGFRRSDGEGVENVSNLPSIEGFPLRARLQELTGVPTRLDNDANAAAMGEFLFGAGRCSHRLMVVTVGTGIGAGMVVGGQVLRVCTEGLGDPGHVLVRRGGPLCACGARGCAEAVAAVPAILRRACELERGAEAPGNLGDVVSKAASGSKGARQALDEAGADLGMALASLVHVLGPDTILLGGGAFDAAEELLLEPTRAALFGSVQPFFGSRLRLGRAQLGNDAGVVGAAALFG